MHHELTKKLWPHMDDDDVAVRADDKTIRTYLEERAKAIENNFRTYPRLDTSEILGLTEPVKEQAVSSTSSGEWICSDGGIHHAREECNKPCTATKKQSEPAKEKKMKWCEHMIYDPDCGLKDKWVLRKYEHWMFCPACSAPRPENTELIEKVSRAIESSVRFTIDKDKLTRMAQAAISAIEEHKRE